MTWKGLGIKKACVAAKTSGQYLGEEEFPKKKRRTKKTKYNVPGIRPRRAKVDQPKEGTVREKRNKAKGETRG